MKPETAFNALGSVMQAYQETIEDYQREVNRLNQMVAQLAARLSELDSKGAVSVESSAPVHVRGGVQGRRPEGDGLAVGETHQEEQEEAPRVQARGEQLSGPEEVGLVEEERQREREQRVSDFLRPRHPRAG